MVTITIVVNNDFNDRVTGVFVVIVLVISQF